jgi:hypothetical protein
MNIKLPPLEEHRLYQKEEIAQYAGSQKGTNNLDVAKSWFPFNLDTWEPDLIEWRDNEKIFYEYKKFSFNDLLKITNFKRELEDRALLYLQQADEKKRVDDIVDELSKGATFFPVLMQQNDP